MPPPSKAWLKTMSMIDTSRAKRERTANLKFTKYLPFSDNCKHEVNKWFHPTDDYQVKVPNKFLEQYVNHVRAANDGTEATKNTLVNFITKGKCRKQNRISASQNFKDNRVQMHPTVAELRRQYFRERNKNRNNNNTNNNTTTEEEENGSCNNSDDDDDDCVMEGGVSLDVETDAGLQCTTGGVVGFTSDTFASDTFGFAAGGGVVGFAGDDDATTTTNDVGYNIVGFTSVGFAGDTTSTDIGGASVGVADDTTTTEADVGVAGDGLESRRRKRALHVTTIQKEQHQQQSAADDDDASQPSEKNQFVGSPHMFHVGGTTVVEEPSTGTADDAADASGQLVKHHSQRRRIPPLRRRPCGQVKRPDQHWQHTTPLRRRRRPSGQVKRAQMSLFYPDTTS